MFFILQDMHLCLSQLVLSRENINKEERAINKQQKKSKTSIIYLMIWGQSLQAFAFLLAKASQAGSVDTGFASGVENLLVTSLVKGDGGRESEISTVNEKKGTIHHCKVKWQKPTRNIVMCMFSVTGEPF